MLLAVPFRPTLRPVLALIAKAIRLPAGLRSRRAGAPRLERKSIVQKRQFTYLTEYLFNSVLRRRAPILLLKTAAKVSLVFIAGPARNHPHRGSVAGQ